MALPSLAGVGNRKRLQIHPAGLLIILLSFGAWVIALGGVGGAQQNCASGGNSSSLVQVNISCAKTYQWEWWGLWFEIGLLVALFITAFFEAFHKGKQIFVSYFLLATMTLSIGAHNFINSSFVGLPQFNVSDRQQAAYNAGAAGYVLLCIFNFALLIILGYEDLPTNAPKPLEPEVTNNV